MNSFSRRTLLSKLAAASAGSLLPSGCKMASPDSPKPGTITKSPIYLIVQGPWLFSIDGDKLVAHTIDPGVGHHKYTFYDPRNGSIKTPLHDVNPGDDLSFAVTRNSAPSTGNTKLVLSQMKNRCEGLFFDSTKVMLNNVVTDSSHRSVTFDAPDQILSAGLISGVAFNLNGATVNNYVVSWPAAFVLIYYNCDGANLTGKTSYDSFQTGQSISYRKFDIYHTPAAYTCKEDSDHATQYFKQLMALLSFSGSAAPVPTFPCPKYPLIALGGDLNLKCTDIDPNPKWCPPDKRDNHGPSLVNCASGHGGVLGCC